MNDPGEPPLKHKNRFYLSATAAALIALVPAARATAIYTTLGPGGSFDTNKSVFIGTSPIIVMPGLDAYADEFTCPVTATVGSVSLALELPVEPLVASPDLASSDISIRAIAPIARRGPTNIVGTFNAGNVSDTGLYTFTATTPIHLVAGTEYWLFVVVPQGSPPIDWFLNNQGIDNVIGSRTGNGWAVNGSGTAPAFELDTVPEPGCAALCVTTLVATFLLRKRTASNRE